MLRQSFLCLVIVISLLVFGSITNAKILFKDDFEGDTVGAPPKNFEEYKHPHNAANFKIDITKDPLGKSGKVLHTFSYALYIPKVAGINDWTNWVWEWDWMWAEKGFAGTAFRITGDSYYHISPRDDNASVGFWYFDGNWNQRGDLIKYDFGFNTWNRFQVTANGENFTLKIKRRDDSTPFASIKPIMTVTDNNLKKGPLSVGGTNPDSWIDNFAVAENEADMLSAVNAKDKLPVTWGNIKGSVR